MRLIDADALLNGISEFPYGYRGMVEAVIAKQPTIDPVKHGHWIELYHGNYKCSECGDWWDSGYENEVMNDFSYCPHCGAKMEDEYGQDI